MKNRETTIPLLPEPVNDDYNKSIRELINLVISTPDALKLNKFGKKYKSYASVLYNNKVPE